MAYPYVSDSCLDKEHDCTGHENTPVQIPGTAIICGGGFCICECHREGKRVKELWWDHVKGYCVERRERNRTAMGDPSSLQQE